MKNLKRSLITLSLLLALGGVLVPVQIVRADDDPQGTKDSQRKSTTSAQAAAAAFWAAFGRMIWF
jgi:hypothetical protein